MNINNKWNKHNPRSFPIHRNSKKNQHQTPSNLKSRQIPLTTFSTKESSPHKNLKSWFFPAINSKTRNSISYPNASTLLSLTFPTTTLQSCMKSLVFRKLRIWECSIYKPTNCLDSKQLKQFLEWKAWKFLALRTILWSKIQKPHILWSMGFPILKLLTTGLSLLNKETHFSYQRGKTNLYRTILKNGNRLNTQKSIIWKFWNYNWSMLTTCGCSTIP